MQKLNERRVFGFRHCAVPFGRRADGLVRLLAVRLMAVRLPASRGHGDGSQKAEKKRRGTHAGERTYNEERRRDGETVDAASDMIYIRCLSSAVSVRNPYGRNILSCIVSCRGFQIYNLSAGGLLACIDN